MALAAQRKTPQRRGMERHSPHLHPGLQETPSLTPTAAEDAAGCSSSPGTRPGKAPGKALGKVPGNIVGQLMTEGTQLTAGAGERSTRAWPELGGFAALGFVPPGQQEGCSAANQRGGVEQLVL